MLDRKALTQVSFFWHYADLRRPCLRRRFPHLPAKDIAALIRREFQGLSPMEVQELAAGLGRREEERKSSLQKTVVKQRVQE